MGTWHGRGLRGSTLEDLINHTNECYRERHLGLIQKVPTPITPINIDKASHHITLAYFDQKSTVDYIGVVQGVAVCFDAKECAADTFPLQNVHAHQMAFMKDFEEQGGVAFFVLYYTQKDEMFYMPYRDMEAFWSRMEKGGRKSFTYEELDRRESRKIRSVREMLVHYLEPLAEDLAERDEENE